MTHHPAAFSISDASSPDRRFFGLVLEALKLQRTLILERLAHMDQKLADLAASIDALKVAAQVAASREADQKGRADAAEAAVAAAPGIDQAAIEARLEAFRAELDAIAASLNQAA